MRLHIKLKFKESAVIIGLIAATVLLAGCGKAEAPQTLSLLLSSFLDQTINEGESFNPISLSNLISDTSISMDQIAWEIQETEFYKVFIAAGNQLRVIPPDADWSGAETIRLTACTPDELCESIEINFSVLEVNDIPVVMVPDQVIQPSGVFTELRLSDLVEDADHAVEGLAWEISGNDDLAVEINVGVVRITRPDADWTGRETLRFEACDPAGGCGTTEARFVVLGESDVYITHVGVSGFLITTGEHKILIDGLFRGFGMGTDPRNNFFLAQGMIEKLENGLPPFDNIELVITTHTHPDHYDATLAETFMQNNPEAVFVSTSDLDRLASNPVFADRLITLDLGDGERAQLTVNGIEIEAMNMRHNMLNIGFVLHLGETTVFHPGDLDVELVDAAYIHAYGIDEMEIDVAFAPIYSINAERNHQEIFSGFQARYLVLMHFPFPYGDVDYNLISEYFPDAIVLNSALESWLLPRE